MHQRLMKSSAKPESGPECSVPATGCAGTKWTFVGRCGAMSRTIAPLTEPTSETIAPGFEERRDLLRDRAAGADRNAEDHEVGVLDGFRVGLQHAVDDAELLHPRAGFRRARGGDDFAGKPLRPRGARDRAADQAEADQRDALEDAATRTHLAAMKSRRASTTRRLASSVPMVMRSACGRP